MVTCEIHSLVCYEGGAAASLISQWLGLGSAGQRVWCQSVIGVRQWLGLGICGVSQWLHLGSGWG